MGILDRINAQMRGERAWPVGSGVVWPGHEYLGHDDDRFSPEEYGSYIATSSDVHAAITLRARLMSGLDLRLFAGRGAKKALIDRGPVVDLLRHVNPFWTTRRLIYMDELSMGLWGKSYWAIERGPDGMPHEIWWMKPSQVRPEVDAEKYITGFWYEPITSSKPIWFAADEVVWFRYPNPLDEFSPLSPLAAARLAADTGGAMMKANRNLFSQGLMSGGLVVPATDKVTFSPEQAKDLERDLARRMSGVDNAHRWAVLRYEAQFKGLNVTPQDAQYVEGMNLTLRQVANAYGIPTPLLNDMQYATLSNAREYQQILWAHALVPDADLRASEIEEQLLPMFGAQRGHRSVDHVAWDYESVPALQEARGEVWSRDRQAMEAGALTINEWRERNGLPPVDWGSVWWAPANKFAVDGEESAPGASDGDGSADSGQEARDLATRVTAAGVLIRSGFKPEPALLAVGLDPIEHLGLLPVTLREPVDEDATEDAQDPPVEDEAPDVEDDPVEPEVDERAWRQVLASFNSNGHKELT